MKSKAIVTVLGKDQVGIVAKIATTLSANQVNIEDISQTIMGETFSMVMLVTLSEELTPFASLSEELRSAGDALGLQVTLQHQDVFSYMHRV